MGSLIIFRGVSRDSGESPAPLSRSFLTFSSAPFLGPPSAPGLIYFHSTAVISQATCTRPFAPFWRPFQLVQVG